MLVHLPDHCQLGHQAFQACPIPRMLSSPPHLSAPSCPGDRAGGPGLALPLCAGRSVPVWWSGCQGPVRFIASLPAPDGPLACCQGGSGPCPSAGGDNHPDARLQSLNTFPGAGNADGLRHVSLLRTAPRGRGRRFPLKAWAPSQQPGHHEGQHLSSCWTAAPTCPVLAQAGAVPAGAGCGCHTGTGPWQPGALYLSQVPQGLSPRGRSRSRQL